jgi:hypothetical protein
VLGSRSKARARLDGPVGNIALPGPDAVNSWGRHRWHQDGVRLYPDSLAAFDDVPRLFREHVLPGHAPEQPLLKTGDTVVTLGSCFAQELREVLELADFDSSNLWVPSGLNNTYALLDFVSWAATGQTTPLAYRYERSQNGQLGEWTPQFEQAAYQELFRSAGALVFTLGLAEVWVDSSTGLVFWRGVPEEIFDRERHEFRVSTIAENEENLRRLIDVVRSVNGDAPIVLTLSPVPLLATFRDISCLTADCVSKSILRVALDNVLADRPENVYYWPSFELVRWAGSAFDWRAFGQDARHPHRYLVQSIVEAFVDSFYGTDAGELLRERLRERGQSYRPPHTLQLGLSRGTRTAKRARNKVMREVARMRKQQS